MNGAFLSQARARRRGERRGRGPDAEGEGATKVLRREDTGGVLAEGGGVGGAAPGAVAAGRRRQRGVPPLLELPRLPLLRVRPHRPLLQRSPRSCPPEKSPYLRFLLEEKVEIDPFSS